MSKAVSTRRFNATTGLYHNAYHNYNCYSSDNALTELLQLRRLKKSASKGAKHSDE